MATENVFTSASKKAKAGMDKAEAQASAPAVEEEEEEKVINVRVPASLHKQMRYRSIETGESMNRMLCRLIEKEMRHYNN